MNSLLIFVMVLASVIQSGGSFRAESASVESIDTASGVVAFVDSDDEVWEIVSEETDKYHTDDRYTLVFNDMGTEDIHDDEIVAVMKLEVVYVKE